MSVQRIASRYAKSLIELAIEQDKLDRVLEDVQAFRKATKNRDFYLLMKSPIVHVAKKSEIVEKIFAGKFEELTISFLKILISKGREVYLPEIANSFISQYKKFKHISTVRLTTASKLSEEGLKTIRQKLKENNLTEENIEFVATVDPNLIGGFILSIEDKIYDASVAHKLEKLKKEFKENPYISQIIAR